MTPPSDESSESPTAAPVAARSGWRARFHELIREYGRVAIVIYLVIFFATWLGFIAAIQFGFEVEGAAQGAGLIGAAWVATKVTQPLRIGATLILTPPFGALWRRVRGRARVPSEVAAIPGSPPPERPSDSPGP